MTTNQEEPQDDPIGGGGLPYPKRKRTYGKLPGMTHRQTYNFIIAIPSIQLAILFISFVLSATEIYRFSYNTIVQVVGFSLLTSLYQWYSSKFMGSCISAVVSVYTLIAVSIVNILYSIIPFNYYFVYGAVLTGVGLFIATAFLRRR